MSLELHLTKDQSHTLYVPELDETYHSRNGALEEAMYVYIGRGLLDWLLLEEGRQSLVRGPQLEENGFPNTNLPNETADCGLRTADSSRKKLSLLEVGFGTGLNAWLTAREAQKLGVYCVYHSLETVPLPLDLIGQLNYTKDASEAHKDLFQQLHQAEWNKNIEVAPNFTLTKWHVSLQDFTPSQTFDVIYFDAFAPEKQPELWTKEIFQKLYDSLNENGVIVTYSSKGDVKRMWKEIGFEVERLPGPPMKRHMLKGRK